MPVAKRTLLLLALVCAAVMSCGSAPTSDDAASPSTSATPTSTPTSTTTSTPTRTPDGTPTSADRDTGTLTSAPTTSPAGDDAADSCDTAGRYLDYSGKAVASECYNHTVLFFHAPWCTECRGFEKAIESDTVPEGAQILKVDYDSATDLRKKYGVTIQSTFVRVDRSGERVALWSGYGQDKSVDAILEHTR